MSQPRSVHGDRIPEEIRVIVGGVMPGRRRPRSQVGHVPRALGSPEVADLISDTAPAFFHIVAESLRNDIVQSICRLGDPSRSGSVRIIHRWRRW